MKIAVLALSGLMVIVAAAVLVAPALSGDGPLSPELQDTVIAGLQDTASDQYAAMRRIVRSGGDAIAAQAIARGLIDADA